MVREIKVITTGVYVFKDAVTGNILGNVSSQTDYTDPATLIFKRLPNKDYKVEFTQVQIFLIHHYPVASRLLNNSQLITSLKTLVLLTALSQQTIVA